ncbi:MAG TPA: MerR family transcriptional regulator [Candidatus Pullichristensenella stercorigallinarum]|uniref:MerR family transcriptional regulator n=1 Tax=Candidatus Pullichristensenella stercorigallinarum TaxID=2840909 RepID=A0A9D0ZLW8_9FIRM|nr:MerR family transcriptional regulator [Candidatus Pullichristensenella stercorigallinarum]
MAVTMQEASERYNIPMEVVREYESWGGMAEKDMGVEQCGDADLEALSLMMTLRGLGFTAQEIKSYMRPSPAGAAADAMRLRMLECKRVDALRAIHVQEQQLEQLDSLRHRIRAAGKA